MNEQQARQLLNDILAANQANNYADIDRSPAAIEHRRNRMRIASDPSRGSTNNKTGFGAELEQHVINGDLTSEQSIPVLMALYGLK